MVRPVIGLALVLFLTPLDATELSGSPDELRDFLRADTRMVTLRGIGEQVAYTDIAKIDLIVTTRDRALATALSANVAARETLTTRLTREGLDADKISSAKYSASPHYGWFGKKPSTFEVVNTLTVEVATEDEFRLVAEQADSDDRVSFGGVEFEHSEEDAFRAKVRDEALDDILANARFFEERLGLTLKPVRFSYSDVRVDQPERMGELNEIVVTAKGANLSAAAPAGPPPSFDEVTYRVTLQVSFEVEAAAENQ